MKVLVLLATLLCTMFVCGAKGRSFYQSTLSERLKRADQRVSELQAMIALQKMGRNKVGHGEFDMPSVGKRKRANAGYLDDVMTRYEESPIIKQLAAEMHNEEFLL